MEFGSEQNDADSPQSLNESFRNFTSGLMLHDFESSGHSLEGSFRKPKSVISVPSVSGISSSSSKPTASSRRVHKGLKDYRRNILDFELFAHNLEDWVLENYCSDSAAGVQSFSSPFPIDDLLEFDLALENVLFQQLFRMPCSPYSSNDLKEDEYLALEDFLHAITSTLWHTFWRKNGPLPFFMAGLRYPGSKFYTLEKAVSRGKLEELNGLALICKSESDLQVHWDQVMEFALFRPNILSGNVAKLSSSIICEALFYGFHVLLSRALGKSNPVLRGGEPIFILVFDSKFGGVVKFKGDISKLELNPSNPYQAVAEWIKCEAEVFVSSVDRVWNKLGNANWGDLGALQLLLATYHSIARWMGPPRKSIASLASDHSLRVQKRWIECRVTENENAIVPFRSQHGEIVELDRVDNHNHNDNDSQSFRKQESRLKLEPGEILLLQDKEQGKIRFQVQESSIGGSYFLYTAVSVENPSDLLTLYVGVHSSRLEPSWEDMSLWYQVQRQTKVLKILKQQGVSSKYLPEMIASGRILHPGTCKNQTPGGRCDHPWCGIPILVTSPVGDPVSSVVACNGPFSSSEALRCCRDCLAALRSASTASVQHGDICPDNILRVCNRQGATVYVPVSWGRAVLEERESPAINLQFSSSHALQHGKLCPSSDTESLVYVMFYICGGDMQQQDSIESALQWRERMWAKRLIQQKLGDVSALLKAFADYVDSLCGTPYPVDYEIWFKRLSTAVDGSGADKGKMIQQVGLALRLEDGVD